MPVRNPAPSSTTTAGTTTLRELEFDRVGEFDVILSRFGVMFFADAAAAFARLRSFGTTAARLGFAAGDRRSPTRS
jgi:hypothetical protein